MATYSQRIVWDYTNDASSDNYNIYLGALIFGRSSGVDFFPGVRFTGVNIPKGSVINSATLTLVSKESSTNLVANIYGVASDNTAGWSSSNKPGTQTLTTAAVSWNTAWSINNVYNSPDLKSIIQEIVNRSGWVSGNSLSLTFRNAENNSLKRAYGSSEDAAKAALLTIDYTPAATGSSNFFQLF